MCDHDGEQGVAVQEARDVPASAVVVEGARPLLSLLLSATSGAAKAGKGSVPLVMLEDDDACMYWSVSHGVRVRGVPWRGMRGTRPDAP
jgi:hypothetical protein